MQNARFPYDVAALNNSVGSAPTGRAESDAYMTIDTTASADTTALSPAQQQRLGDLLGGLNALAAELDNNPEALLALLRQLEQLHRNLQDGAFRSSLPADRGQLFTLLRAMEQSGGWPYIPRLQLRTFMDLLQPDRLDEEPQHPLAA